MHTNGVSTGGPLGKVLRWTSPDRVPTKPQAGDRTVPSGLDIEPWITDPAAVAADNSHAPVALQFRRDLSLKTRPSKLIVQVSADNRFTLYVNGQTVAFGPARGDIEHWRFESIDISPYLHAGHNVVAAEVWNDARLAPVAQISSGHTGFMLRTVDHTGPDLDTGPEWRVRVDGARHISSGMAQLFHATGPNYYAAGAPETFDGAASVPDWNAGVSRAVDWHAAVRATELDPVRHLVADNLPQMTFKPVAVGKVVRHTMFPASTGFPTRSVTIPAHSDAAVLLDAGRVLSAYPSLLLSGGKGATVSVTYTEALYDPDAIKSPPGKPKSRFFDRSTVANGLALGLTDTFSPDGRTLLFQPFWWRTWRFAEIKVKTGDTPLTLDRFEGSETQYPFKTQGSFASDDPTLDAIWRIGWNTVKLDAHETYMDTAYWEQLQYIGDTRLEAMASYDVAGDSRLAVQAIRAFDASRSVDGLPQAAWPASRPNSIPPFGLLWIGMVHDFWMRQSDVAVVKDALPGVRAVIDRFAPYVASDGLVGPMPGWAFVDWASNLDGVQFRNTGKGPESCVISLLYVGAFRHAGEMEHALGDPAHAAADGVRADAMSRAINASCWDPTRAIYADTPDHASYSQHANALAVLYDVAPVDQQKAIMERTVLPGHGIDPPQGMTGTTYYFSYYLAQALDHAGLTDRYFGLLDTWRAMVARHFTAWPENPDPSRSDSHAWSAHPTAGLLEYVAGIEPDAPGFARVRVAPHLARLKHLQATLMAPSGPITVRYNVTPRILAAQVRLPSGLSGHFDWQGRIWPLHSGLNALSIPTNRTR